MAGEILKNEAAHFWHDLDETRVSELIKCVGDKAVMGSSYKS